MTIALWDLDISPRHRLEKLQTTWRQELVAGGKVTGWICPGLIATVKPTFKAIMHRGYSLAKAARFPTQTSGQPGSGGTRH